MGAAAAKGPRVLVFTDIDIDQGDPDDRQSLVHLLWYADDQYFRVGDTPSVIFLVDPEADLDDPTRPSWAGRFARPFPGERPDYFTDDRGPVEWDYADPCRTWEHHVAMDAHARGTLLEQRPEMYAALIEKLRSLYPDRSPEP